MSDTSININGVIIPGTYVSIEKVNQLLNIIPELSKKIPSCDNAKIINDIKNIYIAKSAK